MRNSEAQRYARWSAAVAAILALIVTGVYLRNAWLARQAAKKAPPSVPSTVEQQSNEFSYSKVEGQRTIYTVKASRATEFKEGSRNLLEDVSIAVYGKKSERNDQLRTRACDFISDAGKITCAGEVQISLQAGGVAPSSGKTIEVTTSGVSFDQHSGEAQTEKPVAFKWPAGQGHAIGLRYDSDTGVLYLEHDLELTASATSSALSHKPASAPSAPMMPEKALHLTGGSLEFHREARTVEVHGNVNTQQGTYELTGESLVVELDTSFQARRLVASGHPRLQDTDARGPISLDADQISAEIRPDGSVESIHSDGNVHGNRSTPAGDDRIEAGRVEMNLETRQNAPRLLRAGGGVVLTSHAATPAGGTRRVATDTMEIHFASDAGGGSVPGPARVENLNTLAPATIDWQNVAMVGGKPTPQKTRMNGKMMDLKFGEKNQLEQLTGSGGVEVTRQLGDGPEQKTTSRDLTAKFDVAGQWSEIDQAGNVTFHEGQRGAQGARAHLDHATNTATLTGAVVLTDATTRTTAQSAVLTQNSNQLSADGGVLTTELRGGSESLSNFADEPAHVSADHLVVDTVRGHALYSGHGRLWQGQSVIEAGTIELDSPSQTLIARGKVHGVFPQAAWNPKPDQLAISTSTATDRKPPSNGTTNGSGHSRPDLGHVSGELLTYWDKESRARVEQGARVDSAQGTIQANQIDLFFSTAGDANATKQLSRAVATGDVAVRQDDRRGRSNKAEYTASEGKFVLSEGNPTLYDSTGDTTTGRQLTFYFADDRIVVDSEEGTKTVTLHRVEK